MHRSVSHHLIEYSFSYEEAMEINLPIDIVGLY